MITVMRRKGQLIVPDATAAVVSSTNLGQGSTSQSSPSDPTGTTDTGGKMMGLAGSITPATTGRVLVIVNGTISNSTGTAGNGAKAQLRYGTGTAPANAAALTGTAAGSLVSALLERATASDPYPFSIQARINGLVIGTVYWLDISLAAISAGTAVAKSLTITAVEV